PLLQVIETTANALWSSPLSFVEAAVPGTGGFIDTPNQRIGIQHVSPIRTPADLGQIALAERPDLHLADLATIVEDHQPLIGDAILKNGPGLLLVIEKWPGASTLEVTRGIEEALTAMSPGLGGIDIDSKVYRPATYIENVIENLTIVAIVSAILIILVLVGFFFDWRTALIGAVTIPVSLIAATLVVDLFGQTMNLIVLGGLVVALVLVIDDAVVRAHNLLHRTSGREEVSSFNAIRRTLEQTFAPNVSAAIVILVGLIPLFCLSGTAGAFFPAAAAAYCAAIIASSVIALTLAPALVLVLFPAKPQQHEQSRLGAAFRARYERLLSRILARPAPAFVATGILVVIGLGLLTQLAQPGLLPAVRERNLLINWEGTPGTSHTEMTRIVGRAVNELAAIPGIANVGSHIGRAITSDQVVGINSAEIWISIAPDADFDATVAAIHEAAGAYAGYSGSISTYPEKRLSQVLTGSPKDMVVRVYGEELASLRKQAEAVKITLAKIKGISDLAVESSEEEPTIEIKVNLATAQRLGIKPGDVRRYATTLMSGLQVGSLYEQQKVFEVVVWSTAETRNSINSIRDMIIDTPSGDFVRLGDVADVRIVANPAVVKRESVSRYIDVTANVNGRALASVESDVKAQLGTLRFPIEYHAEIVTDKVGGFRNRASSIVPYAIAAGIAILLLLQAAFGLWRLAALAFVILPTALVGGIIALAITGGTLSIATYLGLLAILGISVRNGVDLIRRHIAHDGASSQNPSINAAAVASERAAPV
ncbi:MAG: efflux RND transporter permease subunit, partial [Aestuariivirgaceae bacterium]